MIVLGFPENITQSSELASALGCTHATIDIHRFPDGESRLTLPPALPERVILFRSLHDPNAKLTELFIAAGGARALGAQTVTLVVPYLCYMRQDIAFAPGQPVSQRIIGKLLAGQFDTVITIDPHLHRVATLEEAVPAARAVCLSATGLLGEFLATRLPKDALLLGPDEESAQWVSRVAKPGGFEFAVASKQRFGDADVRVTLPVIPFAGRAVVLVDDVISSGHTMMEAASALKACGALHISAIATHGLFAPGAREGMARAGIQTVWVTDTISPSAAPGAGITLLPVAGLLADAVRLSAY